MAAGARLRKHWNAALTAADPTLEWSELEAHHLSIACDIADRVEVLRKVWRAEATVDAPDAGTLVRLSSEIRNAQKAEAQHLGYLSLGNSSNPKSAQHQAAVNARWSRRRAEHDAAREARGY